MQASVRSPGEGSRLLSWMVAHPVLRFPDAENQPVLGEPVEQLIF